MTRQQQLLSILTAAIMVMTTGVWAQEATQTTTPPPNYTDGRINDNAELGGLAIYCVDIHNNTHINSFEEGAITVWGIGDQKYMELAAYQLRGRLEVRQAPSVAEAELRLTATPVPTAAAEATDTPDETLQPGEAKPFLVARAHTPNGIIGLFRVGEDEFALQGHDDKGNFFSYRWHTCEIGALEDDAESYDPVLEVMATPETTETVIEATVTPESTESVIDARVEGK